MPLLDQFRTGFFPRLIYILMGVVIILQLISPAHSTPIENRQMSNLSVAQGLSQSSVNCLLQDSLGFLWIGTQDGLNRYDGNGFLVYHHDPLDPSSLSDNFINTLLEDREGIIWIGTQNGWLNSFDRKTGHFTRHPYSPEKTGNIGGPGIFAIRQDAIGDLWLGTWGGGLARFKRKDGQLTFFRNNPADPLSLSNNNVWSVYIDRLGMIWAGTYAGLNLFNPQTQKFVRYLREISKEGLTDNNVLTILEDHSGTIWVGTWQGGLLALDRKKGSLRVFRNNPADPDSLSDDSVISLCEDPEGRLWIGTSNAGLNVFDGESFFRCFQKGENSRPSDEKQGVKALVIDQSGIIWAGTTNAGLKKILPPLKLFGRYSTSKAQGGLSGNNIWAVLEDRSGTIWASTNAGGIDRLAAGEKQFTHYRPGQETASNSSNRDVYSILEDRSGTIWIGTNNLGLFKFDSKHQKFVQFPKENAPDGSNLQGTRIMTLWEDSEGILWAGTFGKGVFKIAPQQGILEHLKAESSNPGKLSSNSIIVLRGTRDGALWMGTYAKGLECYANGTFTHYRHNPDNPNSLRNDRILSLYEDPQGALWIGTWGGGLHRLSPDRRSFTAYTEKDGLSNNTIYGNLGDSNGDLWLSTNRGICRFSPSTQTTRIYSTTDGVEDIEFCQGASSLASSGRMYFGGQDGITFFLPDQVRDNPHIPALAITGFKLFGLPASHPKDYPNQSEMQLQYDENSFSIEFAALDFIAPEKNRYRYILEGFDKSWSRPDNRPLAQYTQVPPGRYIFRVHASNNDGRWNETGASLHIILVPPLWATWWAYCFYTLAGGGALLLIYRWRTRTHHRQLDAQREELRRERVITETLRRADEAVRKSEEQFKQFMSNFPGIAFIKDADSRTVFVNKAFEDLFGVSNAEIAGKKDEEIWSADIAAHFRESDLRILAEKKPVEFLDVIPFLDRIRFFQTTKFPIFNAASQTALVGGLAIEITDKIRAEELLRLQSAALQSAANAIVITNRQGEITWINQAFTELTGYSAEEVKGKTLKLLNSGMHPPEFYADLWNTILDGKTWRHELVNRRKNGTTFIEEMTITPVLDEKREIVHFIAIKQDVTEKKKLQQQLLQSQKLESIGTLAGGVAHDFNNLLGIIIGYTALLKEQEAKPQEISTAVNAIERAAQRGATLVRQILTFARKSEAAFKSTDLNEIIRELASMLLETFPRHITVHVNLVDALYAINADHGQIHQALLNLCLNSRDAMPSGGRIEISTFLMEPGELQKRVPTVNDQAYVCVSVSDTGVGMDEEARSRIFEPFYTTKGPGKGTGLGLAVVYGVMQVHHGHIEVESIPGKGTTFKLCFPLAAILPAPPENVIPFAPVARRGSGKILVIEDEELIVQIIQTVLQKNGYQFLVARNGEEGIQLYQEHQNEIDLVFTDYGLPQLTGAQIFERLRTVNPDIKVLFASGNMDPELRRVLLLAGARAFLQKPYSMQALLEKIHEILSPSE
jgi:PAS domain S-box-containing protein